MSMLSQKNSGRQETQFTLAINDCFLHGKMENIKTQLAFKPDS
jgi:hypothetical protein